MAKRTYTRRKKTEEPEIQITVAEPVDEIQITVAEPVEPVEVEEVISEPVVIPKKQKAINLPSGGNVKKMQLYIGVEAHGKFDSVTRDRLKLWQKKKGLTVTGLLDDETKQKMGI